MTNGTSRARSALAGPGSIAVAMAVMNLGTYGFTIVAARTLGPQSYGGFASIMGLLIVLTVPQLGLQATGARRIASQPADVAVIERQLLRVGYGSAAVLAVVCLALTPVFNAALHLDSTLSALLVAAVAWPVTVQGAQAGVLQGERRWRPLALQYAAMGVPRIVLGSALVLWKPTEASAVLGVALAQYVPVLVGWIALRRSAGTRPSPERSADHSTRRILAETARNSHALLAFFALSNADVILARGLLDRHESGLYAGGLILTKAMLFLPQFVVVIAFPSMADEDERRDALTRSVLAVLALGLLGAAASWLLSGLAVAFIGGPEYAEIQDQLWLFALLGMLLSVIQLVVYSVVARQATYSVYLIWAVLVVFILVATQAHTVTALVVTVCLVDAALFLMLLGITLWRLRTTATPEPAAARAG